MIAAPEADSAQEVGEPVAALVKLAIGDDVARPRHDNRRLVRARLRVQAWIHALPPGRENGILVATRPGVAGRP